MQLMKLNIGGRSIKGYNFTMTENRIDFFQPDGKPACIAINGRGFSFEPTETRDWIVVIGTGSKSFWAQREDALFEEMELLVQDNLTEDEARELADELSKTRNKYKF